MTNTREIALDCVMEIMEKKQYSHYVLKQVLDKYGFLEKRDRSFIKCVTEGTIERAIELDYVLDQFSKVKVKKMKPLIRSLMRMSVYQLLYMDKTLDAAVCKETNNSVIKDILNRFHLGKLSYVAIAVKQILSARQTSCDITLADQSCHHFEKVLFIVTMIQPYEGGGIKMAPMADGNDGLFDVMVVSNLHPLRAFYLLPMAFFGKHVNSRCVHFFKTESLTIHTKDAMTVHVDGEYAGELNQIQLNCTKNMLSFI